MSATLNRAQLIGNLGRDLETRSKQDGSTVITFNLATSESWKDKQTSGLPSFSERLMQRSSPVSG
jgi:single-stranded DNA-binding protein